VPSLSSALAVVVERAGHSRTSRDDAGVLPQRNALTTAMNERAPLPAASDGYSPGATRVVVSAAVSDIQMLSMSHIYHAAHPGAVDMGRRTVDIRWISS